MEVIVYHIEYIQFIINKNIFYIYIMTNLINIFFDKFLQLYPSQLNNGYFRKLRRINNDWVIYKKIISNIEQNFINSLGERYDPSPKYITIQFRDHRSIKFCIELFIEYNEIEESFRTNIENLLTKLNDNYFNDFVHYYEFVSLLNLDPNNQQESSHLQFFNHTVQNLFIFYVNSNSEPVQYNTKLLYENIVIINLIEDNHISVSIKNNNNDDNILLFDPSGGIDYFNFDSWTKSWHSFLHFSILHLFYIPYNKSVFYNFDEDDFDEDEDEDEDEYEYELDPDADFKFDPDTDFKFDPDTDLELDPDADLKTNYNILSNEFNIQQNIPDEYSDIFCLTWCLNFLEDIFLNNVTFDNYYNEIEKLSILETKKKIKQFLLDSLSTNESLKDEVYQYVKQYPKYKLKYLKYKLKYLKLKEKNIF